ncbi:hypothetical protein K1719_007329 [Acacia pycnantha]|nr:hypothetical protein K1719_007329 [Acacia pycnantha]
MACSDRFLFLTISMVMLFSAATAVDHVVGGDQRWNNPDFNYVEWAQDKVFQVGDNLVFNYDNTKHNVFKLNGTLFNSCSFPAGTESLSGGNDVVQLTTPGRMWYACGKNDHCLRGMKFAITVLANGPSSAPTPPPPSSHALSSSASYGPLMVAMLAVAAFIFA